MSALSCGRPIKISAVHHLDLSQCTRVTDSRTDRRTDRITTPNSALAGAGAVKTVVRPLGQSVIIRGAGL